jgi:GNAT superfamily N-acetyltransferase
MASVRELHTGETHLAAKALLELRSRHATTDAIVDRVDRVQRPAGYRVAAAFDDSGRDAAAAAGFRIVDNLNDGRILYVDDLVTLPEHRGRGHSGRLIEWLAAEAHAGGCDQLHLDSGVGPERQDAHRLYFRHGMRITAYHFARPL